MFGNATYGSSFMSCGSFKVPTKVFLELANTAPYITPCCLPPKGVQKPHVLPVLETYSGYCFWLR